MGKKKLVGQAVLISLLALSCQRAVWAEEGVDMPFSTPAALETLGGTASIISSNVDHVAKGIYSSSKDFIYTDGAIKLDIEGFARKPVVAHDRNSIGIFAYNGTVDLKQIEMNFIDGLNIVNNMDVYGVKTYASGVVKLGNDSKISISGNVSNVDSNNIGYVINALYAGDNATMDSGIIEAGNNLGISVVNTGNSLISGISSYNNASISVGNDMSIFVLGQKETRGVEVGYRNATVDLGTGATMTVRSAEETAVGVFVFNSGSFTAGSGLLINASTGNTSETALGLVVKGDDSKAELNGANIDAQQGTELGYAIFTENNASVIGNTGQYYIIGNIISRSGSLVDITSDNSSVINGWIQTANDAETNISLADNSLWIMTGDSNLTNLVNDSSVIDMTQNGNTFNTLKVEHLSGSNGTIKMNVDASKNSANSDKLYVIDTLSGTQYVDLYDVNGYVPVGEEGVGTILATVNNNNGTMVAKDGEGTLYWKRYELDHQETADTSGDYTRDWYLKKVGNSDKTTTSVDTILTANALNYHTWRTENDKLLQRMGELRHNGEESKGAWFRVKGSKIGRDGKFGFENKYTAYELGYDEVTKRTEEKTRYQGVAFSYTDGSSSYSRGSGDNNSKAISFYNTEIGSKGHYLDLVFKISNMDNDFTVYDTNSNKITGDFNNTGVALSAEYGRKNALKNGWYIEPQAQFTLGYLGGDSYTASNGIEVNQSGIKSAVGRIGFNIGKEIGSKGIVYAKANLLHEFGGGYDVTMTDSTGRVKVSDSFNDTWFEYGIGAAFASGKNSHVYFDVERSAGSDFTKNWQWNIGARWNF